jgi:hypothetical protein
MDYQECQRYYELRDAQQHQGGMVRRRGQERFRRSSSMNDNGEIRSILKGTTTRTAHKKAARRFSLTGIPAAATVDDQEAVRSKDDATDVEPRRVGFHEYVLIMPLAQVDDFPVAVNVCLPHTTSKVKNLLSPRHGPYAYSVRTASIATGDGYRMRA